MIHTGCNKTSKCMQYLRDAQSLQRLDFKKWMTEMMEQHVSGPVMNVS